MCHPVLESVATQNRKHVNPSTLEAQCRLVLTAVRPVGCPDTCGFCFRLLGIKSKFLIMGKVVSPPPGIVKTTNNSLEESSFLGWRTPLSDVKLNMVKVLKISGVEEPADLE